MSIGSGKIELEEGIKYEYRFWKNRIRRGYKAI